MTGKNAYMGLICHRITGVMASILVVALCSPSAGQETENVDRFAADTIWTPADYEMAGMEDVPPDILGRWFSLLSYADTVAFHDYIAEGRAALRQLGQLIEMLGGTPPQVGEPNFTAYQDIRDRIISILDKLELALALQLPETELRALMEAYRSQRDSLTSDLTGKRAQLLSAGVDLLRDHQNDPYFLKYPHRREVLAGLYFRVTELTYQQAQDEFFKRQDEYIRQVNELSRTNPSAVATLKPPTPDYSRVMAMFQRIVDEFPTSDVADDALYNIGILTAEGGSQSDRAIANRIFENLIRLYPHSDYVLNSLRRIAEYYFNPPVNQIEQAIGVYERIIREFPKSEYVSEALYKLGWCHYRLNDFPGAVEWFAKALDVGYNLKQRGSGNSVDITTESINYIGVCFALDSRDWSGAGIDSLAAWLDRFPDRKEAYGRELIIQLGVIYRVQTGQYAKAVATYDMFVKMFPLDPRAPEVQNNVVDIFQKGEIYDPSRAHAEKKRFFAAYNPDSEWWAVNEDPVVRRRLIPVLESYLDMLIDESLVLATDQNSNELFQQFESYCRQYLRFWPNGPNAYKVHYNLATVLERNMDRPLDAFREYWQVVNAYSDTSKREIAAQRVVAIAQAFVERERNGEIFVTAEGDVLPAPIGEEGSTPITPVESTEGIVDSAAAPVKATPLLHSEELFLASLDLYTGLFPNSRLTPTMLYQAGNTLYGHNRFNESRYYLKRLILEHPDDRLVEDAYKLIINGYFQSQDYAAVEDVSKRIEGAGLSSDLKQAALQKKAESVFLTATELKKGSDHLSAAEQFRRVALETPDYQYADAALFQAGGEFSLASAWSQAVETYLMVADRYPKSEFADKSLYNAAFTLENEIKDPARAAQVFERLVNAFPASPLVQNALSRASALYNQSGDFNAAIRINDMYVARFPTAEDANIYLFENAGLYLKLNQEDRANDIYRQFAERFPDDPRTIQAHFERARFLLDKGDRGAAAREFRATVDAHQRLVQKKLPGFPKYAAQALAQLLDWEQDEYNKLKFRLPERQMAEAKERKKSWRNSLFEKYQELLRLGSKDSYRAFYQIGKLDEEFAEATFYQEIPEIRDLAERFQVWNEMVNQAILLNEVASQSYRTGMANLDTIRMRLIVDRDSVQRGYDAFNEMVVVLQKDTTAGSVSDSLVKLGNIRRVLTEMDSAVFEAKVWSDSCRERIPQLALRSGDYLHKLWLNQLALRSNDRDEEIRILFREEVLNSAIAPLTAEVCGWYLQAWGKAGSVGMAEQWRQPIEARFTGVMDTLILSYQEQDSIARTRVMRYIDQYNEMLPKGDDAQSPQGFYPDEMGGLILDNVDYWNRFNQDYLANIAVLFDTLDTYSMPPNFASDVKDRALNFVLETDRRFVQAIAIAQESRQRWTAQYEETGELHYDDASVVFEDIAANLMDYDLDLLELGYAFKRDHMVPGMAGVAIMRRLVEVDPSRYALEFGLAAQSFVITTDDQWLVWHTSEPGWETAEFNDLDWRRATVVDFPDDVAMGVLDSLNAEAVWYQFPVAIPERMPSVEPTPPDTALQDTIQSDTTALMPENEPAVTTIEEQMSPDTTGWSLWMGVDSSGARTYWFRRGFVAEAPPSGGHIWLTADDDFSLFVNGVYIAQDARDTIDWMLVDQHDIGQYLRNGQNIIAIQATDRDGTGYGLRAALIYNSLPDLNRQLEILEQQELERQSRLSAERARDISELPADASVVAPPPIVQPEPQITEPEPEPAEATAPPPQPAVDPIYEMRTIEKNKLR